MKLQIATDYAVRILQHLHENDDVLHTAISISESVGVNYHFFGQIVSQLKKTGLLNSAQGRNGGYQLSRPGHEISLYDVFVCIEGELRISRCLGNNKRCEYGEVKKCGMHDTFRNLQDIVVRELSAKSIADLTQRKCEAM